MKPEAEGPVAAVGAAPGRDEEEGWSDPLVAAGRTVAWLSRQIEVGLAEVDLSMPQYRLLGLLGEGSAVSSAIAQRLAVRPPSVTAVVDGLVARGLVQRGHLEGDRRCVALTLTGAGRRTLLAGDEKVRQRLDALLSELAGRDVEQALGGLAAWRQSLRARAAAMRSR